MSFLDTHNIRVFVPVFSLLSPFAGSDEQQSHGAVTASYNGAVSDMGSASCVCFEETTNSKIKPSREY